MNGKLKLLGRGECIADDNEYAGKLLIIKPTSRNRNSDSRTFSTSMPQAASAAMRISWEEKCSERYLRTARNATSTAATS